MKTEKVSIVNLSFRQKQLFNITLPPLGGPAFEHQSPISCLRFTLSPFPQASKDIGLAVNPEKTKYKIMCPDENIVRNGNIKTGNLSFEEVENFKYLGATVTNINNTREEIKRRINMGNACYYSVEKLLSSSLLSKNVKVKIYKTVILLPVVLYGCETWILTLREEQRLRVFENKVFRKIFGAKRDEVTGDWRKLHNSELYAFSHSIRTLPCSDPGDVTESNPDHLVSRPDALAVTPRKKAVRFLSSKAQEINQQHK
ncbi:hypothetical protein ANN_00039 [Periplaneta americana]|uniref:Reverse transcriptase domain-containing protein n=1 Tax=Periplaneta americana TaxID=6978 RepID=A0ABQ8TPZ2_PERAM|nr:hypothetical protein ANN_00039 [Periplaneta americana]